MDYRLLFLLHAVQGLKFDNEDLAAVFTEDVDPFDPRSVASKLISNHARKYFSRRGDWIGDSLRLLDKSTAEGIRWSHPGLEDYPEEWLLLSEPPPVFSYIGQPVWRELPMLAVVGSRTPMASTLRWMQRELSGFIRRRRLSVVSGGARGIDQWAHRICMDEKLPTVCLLPTGILQRYPPGFESLWDRILSGGGALVSTFGPNETMRKNHFHVRNRWIAGLSPLVLVAEANRRSGSLITAQRADEEGRMICTLPLSPLSEQGLGNLDLLSEGAGLIRDGRDLDRFWERSLLNLRSRPAANFLKR